MKSMLFIVAGAITFACLPMNSTADELKTFTWPELKEAGQLSGVEVLQAESPQKGDILKVENADEGPKTIELFEVKDPGITEMTYAIRGSIRYQDVKGKSYLEMWNHFPDGSHYFSRTLGDQGLVKHLEGTSEWRNFALPFFISKENSTRPNRLEVKLVFAGSGTVYLGPMHLEQYTNPQDALSILGAWWSQRTGGIIGAILGTILGCLGGTIGMLVSCGRARSFVMALSAAIVIIGFGLSVAGAVAWIVGQPYEVWYPMLLCGIIATAVFAPIRRTIRRRYEQRELEQILAVDLGVMSNASE